MAILASWCTPDERWLVDRVVGEGDIQYRVWEETNGHQLAAELRGPIERLREWLARQGVDIGDLEPVSEDQECE